MNHYDPLDKGRLLYPVGLRVREGRSPEASQQTKDPKKSVPLKQETGGCWRGTLQMLITPFIVWDASQSSMKIPGVAEGVLPSFLSVNPKDS